MSPPESNPDREPSVPAAAALGRTLTRLSGGEPTVASGSRDGLQRALTTLGTSVAAVLLAFVIGGLILLVTDKNPIEAYTKMIQTGIESNKLLEMLKRATPLMLSAVAVAVGFKMNLFNIGVEGQYFFAALIAAVVGANVKLPPVLHVTFILLVAMTAGAAWAGITAILKVKRGVNEVISTIMLNYIALSFIQWLFDEFFRDDSVEGLNVKTKLLPTSGWMPDIVRGRLNWMFVVSLLVVFLYWIVVFKSRFGFRLRASGLNPGAARTSGISANQMIVISLLISGAVAGLVAMPAVLGEVHAYGQSVPDGLGFAGIAVALLGRNHPLGIVAAALLFGFLDSTAAVLQLEGIPSSIIKMIQAIIVLSVVIVNEASSRYLDRRTADRTASALNHAGASA